MSRLSTGVLSSLCALASVRAVAQEQNSAGQIRVSLPDVPWVLQVTAAGFRVTQNVTQPDGRRFMTAENQLSSSAVSITLEKVAGPANLDGCREEFRGRVQPGGPFHMTEVEQSQLGEMAILEYLIPELNGVPVGQKNIFGCFVNGNVFIDIHVSKVGYKNQDRPAMIALLRSATVSPVTRAENSNSLPAGSAAFFAQGSTYFVMRAYDKAIGPYQEALELEKKERKLSSAQWRVLVDNLAMAYGITGNLTASQEVLTYGLSEDPGYAMFYYITADNYAERNDLENTLKYLRLALTHKADVITGEKLPDPAGDDSFARFLANDDFRTLAAQFK